MSLTINEFQALPNDQGAVSWPADKVTKQAGSSTLTLDPKTKTIVVTADTDCRMVVGDSSVAASATDTPIIAAIENQFVLATGRGTSVLKFT